MVNVTLDPVQIHPKQYSVAQRAVELRSTIKPRDRLKPTPLLIGANQTVKDAFKPVLGRNMSVVFKDQRYDVVDHGDYIVFHPEGSPTPPEKGRLFFHSFSEDHMKKFPNFDKRAGKDYRQYYKSCLKLMDAQNLIPSSPTQDLIWHRGYWGNSSEHGLKIGSVHHGKLPLSLRILSNIQDLVSTSRVTSHFGKKQFVTDPFSKSAAYTLQKLSAEYPRLKVVTHSMGNATLLEALDILKRNNLKLNNREPISALMTHPVYQIKDFVEGSSSHLAIENARYDFADYLHTLLFPLTKNDERFADKGFINPSWIIEMLNIAREKKMLSSEQHTKLSAAIRRTHSQINQGNFDYKNLNNVIQEIYPAIDKKQFRSHPSVHFYFKRYMNNNLSKVMQSYIGKRYAQQINDEILATQPFCVIPFDNGYGGELMNQFFGDGNWKVISGQRDFVAPNPELFVPKVFNINPEKIAQINSRVIPYEDLKKLTDKQFIILSHGSHSSPVIGKETIL